MNSSVASPPCGCDARPGPQSVGLVAGGAAHAGVRAVLPRAAGADPDGQLLGLQRLRNAARISPPDTTWRSSKAAATRARLCVTLKTYLSTLKFCLLVWLITLVIGFTVAYFLAFHVRSSGHADAAVRAVHHPVLDQQRDPHDLLGAAAGPQRAGQPDADGRRADRHSRSSGCCSPISRWCWPSCTCTRCS